MVLTKESRGYLIPLACATSLSVSFMDLLLAMSVDADGYKTLTSLFLSLALYLTLGLLAHLVLLSLYFVLSPKEESAQSTASGVAGLCTFVFAFSILIWVGNVYTISLFIAKPFGTLFTFVILMGIAAFAGIGVRRSLDNFTSPEQVLLGIPTFFMFVAVLLAEVSLSINIFHQTLSSSPAALGAFGAGLVLLAALSYWTVGYIGRKGYLTTFALGCVALVLLGAVPSLFVVDTTTRPSARTGSTDDARPPIILITLDTFRQDSLGAYSRQGADMPNVDALAKDSILFKHAYAPSPWTIPSMVSILTGVSADIHGIETLFAEIPPQLPTLAEYLQKAGYSTFAIGQQPQLLRMKQGFDSFDFYPRRLPYHRNSVSGSLLWRLLLERLDSESKLTEKAREVLGGTGERPFFLWIHYLTPHIPYTPDINFVEKRKLIEKYGPSFSGSHTEVRAGRLVRTEEERLWLRELYDAELRSLDVEIGRLMDHLKDLGLYDKSIIILTNDHGEEFWEHGNWEHGHSLYNELVSAPFTLKLPGRHPGRLVEAPVSTTSILPTLLEYIKVDYPNDSVTAPSIVPLLSSESGPVEARPVYLGATEYYEPREAVVYRQMKLIRTLDHKGMELYDLKVDPGEQHSLVSERPETVDALSALLDERGQFRQTFRAKARLSSDNDAGPLDGDIQKALEAIGYL